MRLSQDIANLLAVAIRDAIWFKRNVKSFLKDCHIPEPYLGQAIKQLDVDEKTIKVVHFLLDKLDIAGDKGIQPQRTILTKMVRWKDFSSLPAERRDTAKASVTALQKAYDTYEAERQYQQEQDEKKMHAEREARGQIKPLDHKTLHAFRDEFDAVWAMTNTSERGTLFQDLMNRIFLYYSDDSRGDFERTGEQIDGHFFLDKHWWYVEVRWKHDKPNAQDVSVLRDRAKNAFGGDTKALFVSFTGFSKDCLDSLLNKADERVILMDGLDLRDVLDCAIAFDILLADKQADIMQGKRAFVSAREIIARRAGLNG